MDNKTEKENRRALTNYYFTDHRHVYDTAIELKYQGAKYAEISKKINRVEGTIKNWFKRKGLLYKRYQDYARIMAQEEHETAMQIYKTNLRNAIIVQIKLLNSENEMVRLAASKEIIERVIGKVPSEFHGTVKYVDLLELFKTIKSEENIDKPPGGDEGENTGDEE